MDSTRVLNPVNKNPLRSPLIDDDKKEPTLNKRNSVGSMNFNRNYQKSKKAHEDNIEIIQEKEEIIRLPLITDIHSMKQPQYIAYGSSNINGELILKDLKGELWFQPSSSILSKKSENRLRSRLEKTNKQFNKSKDGNNHLKTNDVKKSILNLNFNENDDEQRTNFDNNFKRNFDKYLLDVQKLIDYAKNPIFDESSTHNISIDMEKDKRKKKSQNSSYDPGSADSQKMAINGRKPIRVINLELEMKLDNLRNNDIERENFERKIESMLQSKKIQKLNFNILMNNLKIKKIEEVKKLKNEYIERYNQHIIEVLKKEKKLLYNRLNKIKKEIDYKNLCTEMEKERERKLVERVNVNKYDLVLRRWLTLCVIGSRMMLIQDALTANLKEFLF